MKVNDFKKYWKGEEVLKPESTKHKNVFDLFWKGGSEALLKDSTSELRHYIQLRFDQKVPQDKALEQSIAINGRLPEPKRLDPEEVEMLVDDIYGKSMEKN